MALANRRLSPSAFLIGVIGRLPFDRVTGELIRRQKEDSYRTLFKRSFEQRVDVAEP